MKPYLTIEAELREVGKKSYVRKLISNKRVPGVVYEKNKNSISVSINLNDAIKISEDPSAKTRIYEVNYNNKSLFCVLKDMQFDVISDLPVHFDFMQVEERDVVKVNVPVRVLNRDICPGVKNGGDVYMLTYNVDLKCEVGKIPYAIEIDVKDNDMGDKYFLRDIKLPEGCKMVKDIILLRIAGRRVIKEAVVDANASSDVTAETTTTADATKTEQAEAK